MPAPYQGGCQCGQYRYEVNTEPLTAYVCHCVDCQKQSGSAFGMAFLVPRAAVRELKGTTSSFAKTAASGNVADCRFCPQCGTRLFHDPRHVPTMTLVKTGTLDDPGAIKPVSNLWTRDAQPWVKIPGDMLNYETQPSEGLGPLIGRYKELAG